MTIREVDDLELIACGACDGSGKAATNQKVRCPFCHGTGDRVIHKVKYFTVYPRKEKGRSAHR